jgi:hypothetical protein
LPLFHSHYFDAEAPAGHFELLSHFRFMLSAFDTFRRCCLAFIIAYIVGADILFFAIDFAISFSPRFDISSFSRFFRRAPPAAAMLFAFRYRHFLRRYFIAVSLISPAARRVYLCRR